MRECDRHAPTRIKGRPALQKRTRALLIAVIRFGEHRATGADRLWAVHLATLLTAALRGDKDTNP